MNIIKLKLNAVLLLLAVAAISAACSNVFVKNILPDRKHVHKWAWVASSAWGMETKACSGCAETSGLRLEAGMMAELDGDINITMTSYMNSSDSYIVTLNAFKMSKYQVTQAQYAAVMETNPSWFHGGPGREADADEEQGKRPVEQVSWYDAVEFCNALSKLEGLSLAYKIDKTTPDSNNDDLSDPYRWSVSLNPGSNGYRLPTEAQWEYACRAGTTTTWFHDDIEAGLEAYAWYPANSNNKTHEVGLKTANIWGLYDMHGNVFEWCWDWYSAYPGGMEIDYKGSTSGSVRVVRGSGWGDLAVNAASSYRGYYFPYYGSLITGFRLVRP